MDITPEKVRWALLYVLVLLVSVALHEFGHAFMADRLGDDTPRKQGRVTLNPLAHADPIGTLLLPLISAFAGYGFGWGKPVEWQPRRIARRWSMTTAKILVSFAGPAMNLLLALVVTIVHVALIMQGVVTLQGGVGTLLSFAVVTNFVLFFFNLLPVPPLDGGHIAQSFMPYRHRDQFDQVARYAPFALLAIMFIPPLQMLFVWPAVQMRALTYSGIGALFGV